MAASTGTEWERESELELTFPSRSSSWFLVPTFSFPTINSH